MTAKAKNKTRNNPAPRAEAQTQTIALNQSVNADELKALFNAFLECCVGDNPAGTSVVVTKENGKTTFSRRVGETVTKVVSVVKTTLKKAVAQTRSMLRTAWNWTIARLTTVRDFVKTTAAGTKAYICVKAAQLAIAGLILWYMAVAAVRLGCAGIKSAYLRTKNFVTLKTMRMIAWTVHRWNLLKAWSIATWIQVKPHAVQAGRIAAVTAVLYVFATATVLVTCLAVAVLGLSVYDRASESLVHKTNRKSTSNGGRKKLNTASSVTQKSLLGV